MIDSDSTYMKYFAYISIFFLIIVSCKNRNNELVHEETTTQWSSEQIRKYFIDSIAMRGFSSDFVATDSLNYFNKFSSRFLSNIKAVNITDPLIMGLDENYIDTTQIDRNKEWLRITVDPCFDIPYCIIAEKIGDRTKITLKMTNGYGCYVPGYLSFFNSQFRSDTLFKSISKDLSDIRFWQLGIDTTCSIVTDGEGWTIEAISMGQYHLVSRSTPDICSSRETQTIVAIAEKLKRISNFNEFKKLRMQTMTKIIGRD